MANMKWLKNALLASLIATGCFCTRADITRAGDTTDKPTGNAKYDLDFSSSPNGGVLVGRFHNFAFRLDLQKSAKAISVSGVEQRLPDLVATFDYAGCNNGQKSALERPLRDLAAGEAAWVDEVEVVMVPLTQRELKWSGGVCYGFREPGGKWGWNLRSTPLIYDTANKRFVGRIAVRRGPIDALKLVFDYTVPPQFVSHVTFTTRAIGPNPDPPYTPPKP